MLYFIQLLPYEGLSVFSPTITASSIVSGTISTAIAALHNKVRLFINCSSMARYGHQTLLLPEDMPTAPVDPYGLCQSASRAASRNAKSNSWITVCYSCSS